MRHLTIRLQLVWLTIATLAAFALVAATRPERGGIDAEYASNLEAFRQSLGPSVSITTLNQFRASLSADMVFLVAYGLLLRQSVLYAGRHRRNRLARRATVLVMVADATENVCALAALRAIGERALGEPDKTVPWWVFPTMNVAALTKWTVIGMVMVFLATKWRRLLPDLTGGLRFVGGGVLLSFAAGGLGSILVAASFWFPRLRGAASATAAIGLAVAFLLQFRLLDMIGIALRFVFLARVPLIILLVSAGFGPVALGPATRVLGAIVDVPTSWGVAVVTASAIVLAFACATQINLVRAYGAQRTLDRTLLVLRHRALRRAASWTALVSAGSLLFSVGLESLRISIWQVLAGTLGGVAIAFVFLYVLEWLSFLMSESRPGRPMPQLAIPFGRAPLLGDWLRRARAASPPVALASVKAKVHRWSIAGKLFGLASGYIEALPNGTRRLLPGHTFALVQLGLALVFYGVLIFGKSLGGVSVEKNLWVPTAGSVVLLLLLNSWMLAAVTFFFDRYRIPLFTGVLSLTLIVGSRACTDYEVLITAQATEPYQLATPGEVLAAYPRPLVLAVAGGGIQAGAWGARVLEGIDTKLRDSGGGGLRERAALVSGVSGGSMGALYYGAYEDNVSKATEQSLQSSLDEIASALVGVDHLRRVLGLRIGVDRGAALERSWASRLPSGQFTLKAWSDRVRQFARHEGAMPRPFPAFLFNTTIVETGQPMAFITTQFPSQKYRDSFLTSAKEYPVAESANRVFKLSADGQSARDVGVEMVTAARLSAAFPYVSPASTLRIEGSERFHLVDGGYYDNYGLAAVTQWIDDALEEMPTRPAEVGVVIIRGLTESGDATVEKLRAAEGLRDLPAARPEAPNHGWAWQILAPPFAFLRTRSFGQWAGGMQALKLLREKWTGRVTIRPYLFDFPSNRLPIACQAAPLSWKLSVSQQDCIREAWPIAADQGAALWDK